jgi:hypothetical protein
MTYDIQTWSTLLSAIASAGKIVETVLSLGGGDSVSPEQFARIEKDADEFAAREVNEEYVHGTVENLPEANREIIQAALERITVIKDQTARAMKNPLLSAFDKKRQMDGTRYELCWIIREVKNYNAGVIPAFLHPYWDGSNCSEVDII